MRTKQLKIGSEKKEAVLVAGGSGFKVYTASGVGGWVLVLGRHQVHLIKESLPEFKVISQYVNLRYQAQAEREKIKTSFDALVKSKIQPELSKTDVLDADL